MFRRPPNIVVCLTLAVLLSGCATPNGGSGFADRDRPGASTKDDPKPAGLPTPLDLALVPLEIAYYFYNPFLDTQRPTEAERFEQSAKRASRDPGS